MKDISVHQRLNGKVSYLKGAIIAATFFYVLPGWPEEPLQQKGIPPQTESQLRESIYSNGLVFYKKIEGSLPKTHLYIPKEVTNAYKQYPKESLEVLASIVRGAKPEVANRAECYAYGLLHNPITASRLRTRSPLYDDPSGTTLYRNRIAKDIEEKASLLPNTETPEGQATKFLASFLPLWNKEGLEMANPKIFGDAAKFDAQRKEHLGELVFRFELPPPKISRTEEGFLNISRSAVYANTTGPTGITDSRRGKETFQFHVEGTNLVCKTFMIENESSALDQNIAQQVREKMKLARNSSNEKERLTAISYILSAYREAGDMKAFGKIAEEFIKK